jgi:hypothetical protein
MPSAMVLKPILSKAFDQTCWLYIRLLLIYIGFNLPVVNWIMGCISTVSFAVLINGSASPFFRPTRGLRQGCPLSSYLFLIVDEDLSRAIQEAKRTRSIQGVKMGGTEYHTHLLFVDDVLLFTNGSLAEGLKLNEALQLYCKASGMEVKIHKSSIRFNKVNAKSIQALKLLSHTQIWT